MSGNDAFENEMNEEGVDMLDTGVETLIGPELEPTNTVAVDANGQLGVF